MGKLRRMASEFQGQFQEAMREAEMADLKKQVDDMTSQAQSYANFDPVSEVRKELESTQQEIEGAIAGTPAAETPSPPAAAAAGSSTAVATGGEAATASTEARRRRAVDRAGRAGGRDRWRGRARSGRPA